MNPNYKKKITKLLSISQLGLNKIATMQNLSIAFCNNELTKTQNITIYLTVRFEQNSYARFIYIFLQQ
jgi:hypothetical protein